MDFKKFWKETFAGFILKNLLLAIAIIVALSWGTLIAVGLYTHHGEEETIPDLRGLYPEEAEAILSKHGLRVQVIDSVYVRDKKLGIIIDQVPQANSMVKQGRAIYLIINSKQVKQVPLPEIMYVKEYLGFVADMYQLKKNKKQRVNDVMDMVGLRPEFHKKIGQLSKGYRQRVGLAQALIPDPKVLILDEPTTGLDPNQIEEIRSLIRETGKDRTVLFSTHILQEIKAICNRVIVINKGEIVADYPDISSISTFDASHLRFEVEFINDIDETELLKLKNIINICRSGKGKYSIVASGDIREEIFDFALKSGNKILTMSPALLAGSDLHLNSFLSGKYTL